ncbi:MAG: capsular biosynthesis protein, partial [Desulfobacterales bacterium]|nr:capsular biosynthesis protein [Desulfobacterales bacterium]
MNRDLIKKAVEQIRGTRANLIGVALNQVDIRRDGYYKYYSKYYDGYK